MVTVHSFKEVITEEGNTYIRLVLEGGLEMVKSNRTGNFYATTKRASISSTFDIETAQRLVGSTLPGTIIKQQVEAYEYELESGEVIELNHRWVYTDRSDEQLAVDALVEEANAHSNGSGILEEVA